MTAELERAAQHREQAARLLRMSDRETDVRRKTQWLEMASLYHQLAERIEAIHRLGREAWPVIYGTSQRLYFSSLFASGGSRRAQTGCGWQGRSSPTRGSRHGYRTRAARPRAGQRRTRDHHAGALTGERFSRCRCLGPCAARGLAFRLYNGLYNVGRNLKDNIDLSKR